MSGQNTLFMTPEESERITKRFQRGDEQSKARAGEKWKAEDRKELVQHATSTSLMRELSLASLGFGGAPQQGEETMMTYAIGRNYPPCTTPVENLAPMKVSELEIGSHHRGKKLSVRRISPVADLKASSWAAVEGVGEAPDQVAILETFLHKQRMGKDILECGSVFVIKEPFFTLNNDDKAIIRVSHPSDLIITTISEDPESWRDNYTAPDEAAAATPEYWKEKGNTALSKEQNWLAHAYYTRGIIAADAQADPASTMPKDLRRNRAQANLLLKRYDESKSDALASLTRGESAEEQSLDSKAYFRAGSSCYALGEFADAKRYFDEQDRRQPDNKTTLINMRRARKRLAERESGNHDLNKIAATLPRLQWKADAASFDGDTKVKRSPGAGRGLFATRDFKAGELIMCEKAFCIVSSQDKAGGAVTALTIDAGDQFQIRVFPTGLHRAVVQKLLDNPSQAPKVLGLDGGSYRGLGKTARPQSATEGPAIDTFHVHNIVQRNAFGLGAQSHDEDVSNATTGLWVRAAYLNHSCVPNSAKSFVGDLLVLRASRDIRAGEEITHTYDENADYDARRASLRQSWGFACRCALCAAEEEDGMDVRAKRRTLKKEADQFVQNNDPTGARIIALARARRLKKGLEETYDEQRFKNLPKLAMRVIEEWLAIAHQ